MNILAGILLLVVAAIADKPCQVPRRFVGNFNVFTYNIDADKPVGGDASKMYYDADNQRMRVEGQHAGKEHTVMIFYKEAKQYEIGQGYCFFIPTKGKFQEMSIPADARLVTGGRIGTATNGLYVNRYAGEKDGGKGIVTVTQRDCVISNSVSLSKIDGANHLSYFSMTDVSLNYDDSVFNKPAECHAVSGSRARRSVGGFWENLKEVIDSV